MVRFGRTVEDGALPVYSVGDEKEAKDLLILACETNIHGEHIARELVMNQTLENLRAFSDRLDKAHEVLKEHGHCRCMMRT